jgi:hypothetical protein
MTIKIDAHRSPAELAARESVLAAMREKFRRNPPRTKEHVLTRQRTVTEREVVKPKTLTSRDLAHAIRLAARDAKERPNHNPLFVEALEIAATYFDEL